MWETMRIADLGTVITGKTPSSKNLDHFGEELPFITPTDINMGRIVRTERGISHEGYLKFHRLMLPPYSICFVCIGATIGKICMTTQKSLTNQQINSVIVDSDRHDPFFVYYLLSTYAQTVKNIAGGAATPIVNKTSFENIEIAAPPLPIQRKIASILSAYDDLIENNLRRIKILEEMAQNLYREWFVKFRFPGHEKVRFVESELGKIPEGWEVKKLGEIAVVVTKGTTPTTIGREFKDEGINFFKVESINSQGGVEQQKLAKIDFETHEALKRSQIQSGDILFSIAGAIGRSAIISKTFIPANTNQALAIIRILNVSQRIYIFYCIRADEFQNFSLGRVVQTAQANVSLGVLKSAPVVFPPKTLLHDFAETALTLNQLQDNLSTKNTNLRQTRDLLLPKLISGELDVSELDINLPEETET